MTSKIFPRVSTFQDALAHIKKEVPGLSHQNRFGFQILFKKLQGNGVIQEPPESVYLLCQGLTLPPVTLQTSPIRFDEGPFFNRPKGIDVGGDALSFEFVLDVDLRVREFFESWMGVVFDINSASMTFPDVYTHDILVYTLDKFDQPRHVTRLQDAYPRNVSMVQYNQASSEAASLTVTFTYHRIDSWSLADMAVEDVDQRMYQLGYRQLKKGEFPAPDGFDASKLQSSNRGYVNKAINFFASLNPTVYNVVTKVQHKIKI